MRILIDISHPAIVHFFKNFAWEMIKRGNQILFTSRDKDVAIKLLEHYKFDYHSFGKFKNSILGKLLSIIIFDIKFIKIAYKFNPDIIFSGGSLFAAHASFIFRKPNITINNTDADLKISFNKPFTSIFLTPEAFSKNLGKKHIRFKGYNELAFLHPKYFKPNINILEKLGVEENEKFVLLRFVSWHSHDDIGKSGFSVEEIRNIVRKFSEYVKVFISSEYLLPEDLQKYHLEANHSIKTGELQDIEYFASLLYGESGAMAAECAVLGTPAFYISPKKLSFTTELDLKYNLVFDRRMHDGTLEEAINLLNIPNIKELWREKSKKMIEDSINVTDYLVWFTENYPDSKIIMNKNPNYQYNFK